MKASVVLLALAVLSASPLTAHAETDEPLYDLLVDKFKSKPLSLGLLIQAVVDFQPERTFPGENGFSLANFRLKIGGELDYGFRYFAQARFQSAPALLDAFVGWSPMPELAIDLGLMKTPFSREFLTGAGSIDMVNRAAVVSSLAPNRNIGLRVGGKALDGLIEYNAGVYNGNYFDGNTNDDSDGFLYAVRAGVNIPLTGRERDALRIGVNAAYSNDANVTIGGVANAFAGERSVFGADMRLVVANVLVAAEVLGGRLEHDNGDVDRPFGLYAHVGYWFWLMQAIVRWESFSPDGIDLANDLLIVGLNFWPSKVIELQVNWVIPVREDPGQQQFLLNAQIEF